MQQGRLTGWHAHPAKGAEGVLCSKLNLSAAVVPLNVRCTGRHLRGNRAMRHAPSGLAATQGMGSTQPVTNIEHLCSELSSDPTTLCLSMSLMFMLHSSL